MVEIVTIAPLVHEPGLIAYECGDCGYVTSVIIPPTDTCAREVGAVRAASKTSLTRKTSYGGPKKSVGRARHAMRRAVQRQPEQRWR